MIEKERWLRLKIDSSELIDAKLMNYYIINKIVKTAKTKMKDFEAAKVFKLSPKMWCLKKMKYFHLFQFIR